MCVDEALVSCAEYEDDADCGRDGGPSVSVDQTRGVVDVNGGHTCHHHHPVIIPDQYECECVDEPDDDTMAVGDGGGDPGYMFSPVSSYEYDYDYDIPPCCDGDIVDSPVGGDLTLWGDATPHPGTQYPVRPHLLSPRNKLSLLIQITCALYTQE